MRLDGNSLECNHRAIDQSNVINCVADQARFIEQRFGVPYIITYTNTPRKKQNFTLKHCNM